MWLGVWSFDFQRALQSGYAEKKSQGLIKVIWNNLSLQQEYSKMWFKILGQFNMVIFLILVFSSEHIC